MSDTKQFWAGQFGNEYLERNRVDWRERMNFWEMIMETTGARSVHEFGCNAGYNLSAIRRQYPDVQLSGNDVNKGALYQCNAAGIPAWDIMPTSLRRELVFTAGVLIHIAPEDLQSTMQAIVDASTDYVLSVEYDADQEEEVLYRGHEGKLWKRPYGDLYAGMGLKLVMSGDAGPGFDNCTYYLLRKP